MTMTPSSRPVVFAAVLVMLLGFTASASAGERMKHSGAIVSIADDGRTFVLAEVGPWQVRNGATVATRRTITLTPETAFAIVARADAAPSGFPGDFVEIALGPEDVYLGDHVTVDCRHEGRRLIALKITVTEPWADDAGGGTPP
jgi:hypothetical protein